MRGASALRIVTYNIHGCVGVDRRYDPARIAGVLREIDADILCLQEVDPRDAGGDQAAYLATATGRNLVVAAAARGCARFANAILTRFPPLATRAIDLAIPGHQPRCAIDVDLMVGHRILRVVATHFGLHASERRLQAYRLMKALASGSPVADAVVLVGDLNEWRGRAGGVGALERGLGPSATPRTFPSWLPVLSLAACPPCLRAPAGGRNARLDRGATGREFAAHCRHHKRSTALWPAPGRRRDRRTGGTCLDDANHGCTDAAGGLSTCRCRRKKTRSVSIRCSSKP